MKKSREQKKYDNTKEYLQVMVNVQHLQKYIQILDETFTRLWPDPAA